LHGIFAHAEVSYNFKQTMQYLCESLPLFAALIVRVKHAMLRLLTTARCSLDIALAVHDGIRFALTTPLDHYIV
jgi:hypothetical protein